MHEVDTLNVNTAVDILYIYYNYLFSYIDRLQLQEFRFTVFIEGYIREKPFLTSVTD